MALSDAYLYHLSFPRFVKLGLLHILSCGKTLGTQSGVTIDIHHHRVHPHARRRTNAAVLRGKTLVHENFHARISEFAPNIGRPDVGGFLF